MICHADFFVFPRQASEVFYLKYRVPWKKCFLTQFKRRLSDIASCNREK